MTDDILTLLDEKQQEAREKMERLQRRMDALDALEAMERERGDLQTRQVDLTARLETLATEMAAMNEALASLPTGGTEQAAKLAETLTGFLEPLVLQASPAHPRPAAPEPPRVDGALAPVVSPAVAAQPPVETPPVPTEDPAEVLAGLLAREPLSSQPTPDIVAPEPPAAETTGPMPVAPWDDTPMPPAVTAPVPPAQGAVPVEDDLSSLLADLQTVGTPAPPQTASTVTPAVGDPSLSEWENLPQPPTPALEPEPPKKKGGFLGRFLSSGQS